MQVFSLKRLQANTWWKKLAMVLPAFFTAAAFADSDTSEPVDISWYLFDYPPSYITEGPYEGQGYQDQILADIERSAPSIRIHRIATSMARVISNMEHEKGACAGALAKTPERMTYMVFSDPILVSMPLRLVIRKDMMATFSPFLDDKGQVMLSALLNTEAGLKGGVVKGRAYGQQLDVAMDKEARLGNVVRAGQGHLVLRMLARGRIGYTFGYPDEIGFYARMLESEGVEAKFAMLPVAGHSTNSHSHIGCTKDAAGKAFITAVNRVIAEPKTHARWQSYYLNWVDPSARAAVTATIDQDIQ